MFPIVKVFREVGRPSNARYARGVAAITTLII